VTEINIVKRMKAATQAPRKWESGVSECWNTGFFSITPVLHYSTTPKVAVFK
jgi:hypothetical protein